MNEWRTCGWSWKRANPGCELPSLTPPKRTKISAYSAGRPDFAAARVGTLRSGAVVAVVTRDLVVAGPHARKTVVAGGLDDADGGSKKNERSGQLH